jgi:hypothetical protein
MSSPTLFSASTSRGSSSLSQLDGNSNPFDKLFFCRTIHDLAL